MDRYFYFRDVADEADDDDNSSSLMLPVKNITAIGAAGTNSLVIYHRNVKNQPINDLVTITVTKGKLKETMASLVSAMNAGPHHDGVTVIADVMTTTNGASSIQGNDATVSSRFLNADITSCSITAY